MTTPNIRRNGNLLNCQNCGRPLRPKRGSRRQTYCGCRCRSEARRNRNFVASGHTRYPGQASARSVDNPPLLSMASEGRFGHRGYRFNAPRDLLGHACFKFHSPRLDPPIVRAIIDREIRWSPHRG